MYDLDHAEDIALIAHAIAEMQEMINRLVSEGEKVGLVINRRETLIMQIQSDDDHMNCITDG